MAKMKILGINFPYKNYRDSYAHAREVSTGVDINAFNNGEIWNNNLFIKQLMEARTWEGLARKAGRTLPMTIQHVNEITKQNLLYQHGANILTKEDTSHTTTTTGEIPMSEPSLTEVLDTVMASPLPNKPTLKFYEVNVPHVDTPLAFKSFEDFEPEDEVMVPVKDVINNPRFQVGIIHRKSQQPLDYSKFSGDKVLWIYGNTNPTYKKNCDNEVASIVTLRETTRREARDKVIDKFFGDEERKTSLLGVLPMFKKLKEML